MELIREHSIRLEFVNLGGGIGIPYRPDDVPVDLERIGDGIRQLYDEMLPPNGLDPHAVLIENGRMITGPHGYLITKAVHELQRTSGRYGLISMCCGGGLGTGTLVERVA